MIYLDYNATTPILPEVIDKMAQIQRELWGNPSSAHAAGQKAFIALEEYRKRCAELIGVFSEELYFTSGGTESDNLAIAGVLNNFSEGDLIVSSIEHSAVSAPAAYFAQKGFTKKVAPVTPDGVVDLDSLATLITPKTRLVSIMHANNETGAIQPIE